MSEAARPPGRPGKRAARPEVAGKRRAQVKKRHTVAKVVTASLLGLALVTSMSVLYLYRHYNANLNVIDVTSQLGSDRPEKQVEGPKEPLNILVMGSDDRDAPGNNIDNLVGGGKRSDTTILLHLSADRTRAYGVSIPRDSLVNRPECLDTQGQPISAPATSAMWNEAFSIGGAACTIKQFESLTHIRIDHYVVVDFSGFRDMVDAIGGVQVCIPQTIDDRSHGIYIPAGNRKIEGMQALNYVRERYAVGDGSDIGRMKRQQAFIASMANQVVSANTLANPAHLVKFLDASTRSLTLDPGLGNLMKIADLGIQFKSIGLGKIQFITIPWEYDPNDPARVLWKPEAKDVWKKLAEDEVLPPRLLTDAINAKKPPGHGSPKGGKKDGAAPSGSATASAEQNAAVGLCS